MPKINFWSQNVPRVEIDQRSREARLRIERIERLLVPHAAVRQSRLWGIVYLFRVRIYRGTLQESRGRGPLKARRPSRTPTIFKVRHLEGVLFWTALV